LADIDVSASVSFSHPTITVPCFYPPASIRLPSLLYACVTALCFRLLAITTLFSVMMGHWAALPRGKLYAGDYWRESFDIGTLWFVIEGQEVERLM
jgi:hypothetical protein